MSNCLIYICIILLAFACSTAPDYAQSELDAPIFPDYTNVTIPVNMAPMNFLLRGNYTQVRLTVKGENESLEVSGQNQVRFPLRRWKKLLNREQGNRLVVHMQAKSNGQWQSFKPFTWLVVSDSVDAYLSYRLIEPGYEVWHKIQLVERHVETFGERVLADNNLLDNACMNCHIYGNQQGNLSMFHLRGANGGTIVSRDNQLRKVNIRAQGLPSGAVYGNFHPSGRFAVFSSNVVIPEFHTNQAERLEVFDAASDLIVFDFDKNQILTSDFLSDSLSLETFPVFSACGQYIYYCSAPYVPLSDSIHQLKYHILRVPFDAALGQIGSMADTVWNAQVHQASASLLKTSPDGRYLLFTVANYGTFPIWHREADLRLLNFENGHVDSLAIVNGPNSDTYHSWSSNSRWFVFASKRDDGIYGKPYFAYVDADGKAHKPFVLPQRDPSKYDQTLKSFNIPELARHKTPFNARSIEKVFRNTPAEQSEMLTIQ